MSSLWLFSCGDGPSNRHADADLVSSIKSRRPKAIFLAADEEDADDYFHEFKDRFENFGLRQLELITVDSRVTTAQCNRMMQADMIYLSGGNTFTFLQNLRRTQLLPKLKRYSQLGGILAGTSAGAIMMTPNINTASYPDFDCDENETRLRNMKALNLVKFEVFPHYPHNYRYADILSHESTKILHPIYGISDGSAICISPQKTTYYGNICGFIQGYKFHVS